MQLSEFDRSGRRRPVQVEGSEFTLEADTVIVAIGQSVTPDLANGAVKSDRWGQLVVDPDTLETNIPGVYAGGDAVTGPGTVIDAIAAGIAGGAA